MTFRCKVCRTHWSGVFDPQFFTLASQQFGVVGVRQAAERFGISRSSIARARRNGLLVGVVPGVVRVASSPDSFDMRCMALHLRFGDRGFVSGWSAARRMRLRKMPTSRIHYTVPGDRRRSGPGWAEMHRSDWFDGTADRTLTDDGIYVATPLRMLWGLAACFNQFRFERAAEDAWHLGLITPEGAATYLERHRCRGKNGVATMERWLEHALGQRRPAQSGLEQALIEAVVEVGLPAPVPQHPLALASGELIHLDIAWPELRLAVEPGAGWWHNGRDGQRRDQSRDRACAERGWLVARFDESVAESPRAAALEVRQIYRRRQDDLRNPAAIDRSTNESCRDSG